MKVVNINIVLVLIAFFMFSSNNSFSQTKLIFKQYKNLSSPEKKWVIFHPFISKNVYKISEKAVHVADSLIVDTLLDGDLNGGQLDAFRHAFWMALLSQKYNWRKIYKLGLAHEKGNYYQFLHSSIEDGSVPDKVSSQMDLLNNDAGRQLGLDNKNSSECELIKIIKDEILNGNLWIIKKNKDGFFLDENNKIIDKSFLIGKWENGKQLVRSNFNIDAK